MSEHQFCTQSQTTCVSEVACPASGMGCHEGICMLRCGSDNECASNERCNKGQCMLTCRVDNDCFLGHVCLNKMCLVGCR